MAKTKKNKKNEDVGARSKEEGIGAITSVATYVGGGILGLVLLVYISGMFGSDGPKGPVQELPHLTILVAYPDLESDQVRYYLHEIQSELEKLGLATEGPGSFPILIPAEKPGDQPSGKALKTLTTEEFQKAAPYLKAGGWLVGRVFSPDLTQALIRVAPATGDVFPRGTRRAVEETVTRLRSPFTEVYFYSRALGWEDAEARQKINLHFGVQTAHLAIQAKTDNALNDPNVLAQLHMAAMPFQEHPQVRQVVTLGNWVTYAEAVKVQDPELTVDMVGDWVPHMVLGQALKVPELNSPDGSRGVLAVATEAEGEDNVTLCYHMAANIKAPKAIRLVVPRQRKN